MGTFRLQITGNLGDLITHLPELVTDLQNQGIDPAPLKAALVTINLQSGLTAAQNTAVTTALNNWRSQVSGTSILVSAEFATPD